MDSLLNSDEKSLRLTTNEDLWCIFIITSCIQGHLIGDMQVDYKGGISLESKPLFLIIKTHHGKFKVGVPGAAEEVAFPRK